MRSETPDTTASDSRSSTVCYLCRQRKTKCDRILPRCGFCVKAKVDCQYVAKAKKRGLRAGYVSQLEKRIEHLEQELSGLKESQTPLVSDGGLSTARLDRLEQELFRLKDRQSFSSPGIDVSTTFLTSTPVPIPTALTPLIEQATPHPSIQHSVVDTPSTNASRRKRPNIESDNAIADLMTLPREYMFALADLYFKETQPWMPILSRQQIQSALEELPMPLTHIDDVVLKAVISLQIAYSTQAICLGYHGRYRLSQHLRSQVLNEALSKACLKSLQSLLIIAILDYGADNIPSTFSLLSVCRRMCENIGLFRKLLNQIELQSPAQIGPPPSIGGDTGDELAIPLTWATLALDAVSTLGVPWRDVSAALVDHLSSVAYISTPDLKDGFRTHTHQAAIALQPLHTFIYEHERFRYENSQAEALVTCDEIYNNLMSYVQASPTKSSYTMLADGLIDFDPYLVHTSVLSYASIIILYQRLLSFDGSPTTEIPLQRCLQACEDMVHVIRGISDADAELNTPLLAHLFFVATRFKLIVYKNLNQERESIFDTLMHGVNMCGRRWVLARRLDVVLRAAIMQVDTKTADVVSEQRYLPESFWDPRKSHLDLSEELKEWSYGYKESLYVSSLNGPYCMWG